MKTTKKALMVGENIKQAREFLPHLSILHKKKGLGILPQSAGNLSLLFDMTRALRPRLIFVHKSVGAKNHKVFEIFKSGVIAFLPDVKFIPFGSKEELIPLVLEEADAPEKSDETE